MTNSSDSHADDAHVDPVDGSDDGLHTAVTKKVRAEILEAEKKLRHDSPLLCSTGITQDLMGMLFVFGSAAAVIASTYAYVNGILPGVVCFFISAFAASLIHECEHDLIHSLYCNG